MSEAPYRTVERGELEVAVMRSAMLNELQCNAHKGPWTEIDTATAVHEVLYHAVKLALALDAHAASGPGSNGYPEAVLEYAADVALGAMFAASASGALEERHIRSGHAEDHDAPWRFVLRFWKLRTWRWAQEVVGTARGSKLRRWLRAVGAVS